MPSTERNIPWGTDDPREGDQRGWVMDGGERRREGEVGENERGKEGENVRMKREMVGGKAVYARRKGGRR